MRGLFINGTISMFDLYVFVHETLPIFGLGLSCFGLGYILGYVRGCIMFYWHHK